MVKGKPGKPMTVMMALEHIHLDSPPWLLSPGLSTQPLPMPCGANSQRNAGVVWRVSYIGDHWGPTWTQLINLLRVAGGEDHP